ncbi:MAG: ATP-binding protein [Desulfofustis sp. PB-SRB1]|jgi:MinD superfamily P-loop ATPase|nr:ATP-binding protein [Desulfofustis sp. PB-SRB1]MBM1002371.1 ATP-binding protein [Desulfofustis sp. PB-SRB1]HBH28912.1 (4Fe-4S)-binding protein [Desulfofustis sp.]HBH32288.1 (4Fe-4S)-binding protein [Desulfofustis sp.]
MKELVVLSGKGGTGKTTLTAAFSTLAGPHIMVDSDVDAADLHLLLHPRVEKTEPFFGGNRALIREADCTQCGTCRQLCQFDAITDEFVIDEVACEGCGVCVAFCPEKAIDFPVQQCGEWYVSATDHCPMVHARLGIGEENSGKLVSLIRARARELAEQRCLPLILTDGPPGIGCPVIAALTGASAVLVVCEPTVSGLHDLNRVSQLAAHFKMPVLICINKYDLNPTITNEIRRSAIERGENLVGMIPFDPAFTRAMVQGQTIFSYHAPELQQTIRDIWREIMQSDALSDTTPELSIPLYQHNKGEHQ